jgi:hypothetical protein
MEESDRDPIHGKGLLRLLKHSRKIPKPIRRDSRTKENVATSPDELLNSIKDRRMPGFSFHHKYSSIAERVDRALE